MLTRGFVTENQCIGLPPVDQGKGDARKGDMKKRPLSFYNVPMILNIIRSEPLYRPRHKVGRNRIQRNTIACDQYPRLASRSEIHIYISLSHLPLDGEPGIHFTHRTVGTDRKAALACTYCTSADAVRPLRYTNVKKLAAIGRGSLNQCGNIGEPTVKARSQVKSCFQCLYQSI